MAHVPFEYGLCLAAALFLIGLVGVQVRRQPDLRAGLDRDHAERRRPWPSWWPARGWGQPDGQVMFIFILSMAAAEVAVGLALALPYRRAFGSLDIDKASRMRG